MFQIRKKKTIIETACRAECMLIGNCYLSFGPIGVLAVSFGTSSPDREPGQIALQDKKGERKKEKAKGMVQKTERKTQESQGEIIS